MRSKLVKDFDGKPLNVLPNPSISAVPLLPVYPPNKEFSLSKSWSSLTVPLAKNESTILTFQKWH